MISKDNPIDSQEDKKLATSRLLYDTFNPYLPYYFNATLP